MSDYYKTSRGKRGEPLGCIDLVESPDDGGWYAEEYDFTRTDNATRHSRKIYATRESLVAALNRTTHKWKEWS